MTSYFVAPNKFRSWIKHASFANVSKGKVRRDLWAELSEIVELKGVEVDFQIPTADFIAIQTFCLKSGKADNLSNDDILNFATSLNHLLSRLNEFVAVPVVAAQPNVVPPVVHQEL